MDSDKNSTIIPIIEKTRTVLPPDVKLARATDDSFLLIILLSLKYNYLRIKG
jgi:hypothetical protein